MIEEYSPRERTNVLWVGQAPRTDTAELLKQLGFTVDHLPFLSLPLSNTTIVGLAGVVFVQADAKPLLVVKEIETHVVSLLDHGCLVFILATPNGLESVKNALKNLKVTSSWPTKPPVPEGYEVFNGRDSIPLNVFGAPQTPYVFVYRSEILPECDIVNKLVRYGPQHTPAVEVTPVAGVAANDTGVFEITGPAASNVCANHRLMLRRSFHNCDELHLDLVSDIGRSGVTVYIAHATLKPPRGARNPLPALRQLPFFVKIGPRWKIIPEWRNYEERVRQQVPFHLAPRLVSERCELGAGTGIIVGDFVEDSESLGECARSGRAMTPIGTLFDRTLRGWHSQAFTKANEQINIRLKYLLEGGVSKERVTIAKNQWVVNRSLSDIKNYLHHRPTEDLLWGPIHGDLHTDNIRVRGSDAILIDFLSARNGPLLADPAALEASLAIRVPSNKDDFDRDAWLRTIRSLFSQDVLRMPLAIHNPTEPYAWIASCIRQVRLHALPMQRSGGQYAHVLAYYFLQAAIKDSNINLKKDPHGHENFRRAVAYALADSLLGMDWKNS